MAVSRVLPPAAFANVRPLRCQGRRRCTLSFRSLLKDNADVWESERSGDWVPLTSTPYLVQPKTVSVHSLTRFIRRSCTLKDLHYIVSEFKSEFNCINTSAAFVQLAQTVVWSERNVQQRLLHEVIELLSGLISEQLHLFGGWELSDLVWSAAKLEVAAEEPWVQGLLQHAPTLFHEMTPHAFSKTLYGAAVLQADLQPSWIRLFLDITRPQLFKFHPQGLSNVIWALAKFKVTPEPDWLSEFCNSCQQQSTSFSPQSTANTLWACGVMRWPVDGQWVLHLLLDTTDKLPTFRPQELSIAMWAVARLRVNPPPTTLHAFQRAAASKLHDFQPQELANLLHGAAVLRVGLEDWFLDAMLLRIEEAAQHMKPQEQAAVLWSSARLHSSKPASFVGGGGNFQRPGAPAPGRGSPPSAPLHDPTPQLHPRAAAGGRVTVRNVPRSKLVAAVQAICTHMTPHVPSCAPELPIIALWSLSKLGIQPHSAWTEAVLLACYRNLPRFQPRHFAMLLCALARQRIMPSARWRSVFTSAMEARLSELTPAELSVSFWAIARAGWPLERMHLEQHVAALVSCAVELGNQELAISIWACAKLGLDLHAANVGMLLRAAMRNGKRWKPTELAAVMHALGMMAGHHAEGEGSCDVPRRRRRKAKQQRAASPVLHSVPRGTLPGGGIAVEHKLLRIAAEGLTCSGPDSHNSSTHDSSHDSSQSSSQEHSSYAGDHNDATRTHSGHADVSNNDSRSHVDGTACRGGGQGGAGRRRPPSGAGFVDVWLQHVFDVLPQFSPLELACIVWGLGRLHHRPPPHAMDDLLSACLESRRVWPPMASCTILWGLVALGYRPAGPWLQAFVAQIQLFAFPGRDLAMLAWALAKLGFDPGPAWWRLFVPRVLECCDSMGRQDLSLVLWAMVRLQVRVGYGVVERLGFAVDCRSATFNKLDFSYTVRWLWELEQLSQDLTNDLPRAAARDAEIG